jgi:hypothetical protein
MDVETLEKELAEAQKMIQQHQIEQACWLGHEQRIKVWLERLKAKGAERVEQTGAVEQA